MPAADRATRTVPWWHIGVLAALIVLQIWAAIGSNGTYDTYRDIYFAQRISSGAQFPLTGPTIGNIFHLSPLWF